ncbi:transglycosylase domain-containing protein [Oceanobacillus kapialis]|uniref:transglycosylase domain-containing protein n=1 Tax=Oceanobacillus kapialis TaxID=481353 RepID=UPI0038500EEA
MGKGLKKFKSRLLLKITMWLIAVILLGIGAVYLISFLLGPPELAIDQNTVLYDSEEEVIGEERGTQNRQWVDLDEMSEEVVAATLLTEDQNFYDHHGFDIKRIFGAIIKDIQTWSLKEGASTLTQQYARNLYLTHEKSLTRKLKEAFYTVRLEMFYTKEEILEGYLNTIYYGHGAYGIEVASNYFYNKSASDLTLAEATMLAGIPKGPTYYSPLNDEDRAQDRQKQILANLLDKGIIDQKAYESALRQKLIYAKHTPDQQEKKAPHFQDTVIQEAGKLLEIEQEEVRAGGYSIYTTLNTTQQKLLEQQVKETVQSESDIEIGALAVDPENGAITAMIGGRDYTESVFNRATSAMRMPGSSFKPFLYYAALENGYTPNTMLMSKPTSFELADGNVYQPSNFNGYYANEQITLAQAIALSDNVYAVKTNMYLGPERLVDSARAFGITSKLPAVPSLALGTATVNVKEMVTGYGILANGGQELKEHTIEKIVDRHGKTVYEKKEIKGKQILDPQKTFVLTQMLTGMFDRELDGYMSVTGSSVSDQLSRIYAGKSGTTDSDSWMIGYSPSLVTGVWAGYDDNRPMEKVAESSYTKQIWAGFMEAAHADHPVENFNAPSGVVGIPIDPETGLRATPYCESSRVMYFEKGTEPEAYCTDHLHQEEENEDKSMVEELFDLFR